MVGKIKKTGINPLFLVMNMCFRHHNHGEGGIF